MQDDYSKRATVKRYATAAVIVGGGAILGSSLLQAQYPRNYGTPFNYGGRQYYIPQDSRRAVYPSKEACMRDVPPAKQLECEPVVNYRGGAGGSWFGPVYSPRTSTDYRPASQYTTEPANSSNVGKNLPSASSQNGFGANGKAFTGSKGS